MEPSIPLSFAALRNEKRLPSRRVLPLPESHASLPLESMREVVEPGDCIPSLSKGI